VDGSLVVLNPDSQIAVNYSARERGIELRQGDALFSVKDDPARPFIVRSGDIAIRAVRNAKWVVRTH
jgi:transmembrane sensor